MSSWSSKLVGKKIVDNSSGDKSSFSISELPPGTRVLKPNSIVTLDYQPDRLNVHVDHKNICQSVKMG